MLVVVFIVIILLLFVVFARRDHKVRRNATRRCSHCGSQIPYTASVCPVCHLRPGSDHRADAKVGWKSSGSVFARFFLIIMAILLALMVLIVKIEDVGSESGLLKSSYEVTLDDSEYSGIENEEISFTFISRDSDGSSRSGTFDSEGTLSFRLKKGNYDYSMETDDLYVYYGKNMSVSGVGTGTLEISNLMLYLRTIELKFYDTEGNALDPEEVSLYFPETDETVTVDIGDHYYAAFLAGSEGGTVEVQASGYEPVTVAYDEMTSLNTIKVVFGDESASVWTNGMEEKQILLQADTDSSWSFYAENTDNGDTLENSCEAGQAYMEQLSEGTWEITFSQEGSDDYTVTIETGDPSFYYIWIGL